MSWDGTVEQHFYAVSTRLGVEGSFIHFDCGHEQRSNFSPLEILESAGRWCKLPCVQCSKPNWDRIAERRESTTFDGVLAKLKQLAKAS